MSNLPLIKKCGETYQRKYVKAAHEAFFQISPNMLCTEFAKLHQKTKGKDTKFLAASSFPPYLVKTFAAANVKFKSDDCAAVHDLYTIITETASRVDVPVEKLTLTNQRSDDAAQRDVLGRGLTCLSLADVAKHPCLSILYRHHLKWETGQVGAKKGKANSYLAYAYLLYVGWRVYGDTIGRMLQLKDYLELRESLFSFLGGHCQPNLDDFFGKDTDRPAITTFANWDHKLLKNMVDLEGQPLKRPQAPKPKTVNVAPQEAVEEAVAEDVTYDSGSVQPYNSTRMAEHTAAIKKIVDNLTKAPLATIHDRPGTCSPPVAAAIRALALVSRARKQLVIRAI